MLSNFFIRRPVLALVIAILCLLCGAVSLPHLKVTRFPEIAPPTVRIDLRYPGASAQTIENTVAQVVEQQMSGLDNLLYFNSKSSSEGSVFISFAFAQGVNADVAQMQIQNRLEGIMSKLPEQVQKNGVRIRKVSDDTLQRLSFYCDDGSLSQMDIADFIASVVQDPLSRVNGVGSVDLFGSPYAIRVWLDEDRLHHYSLNPRDVTAAILAQNAQISAGQLGALPSIDENQLNITIQSRSLLTSVPEFENIVLVVADSGAAVHLKDVARVEMGRESYNFAGTYNGYPQVSLSINLTEGANAVDTAQAVENFLIDMQSIFPDGLKYTIPYDTVPFVKASLFEVSKTLLEALLLVALVIWVFLGSLRSTLIVCLTIPVVLSATVTILFLCGFSINTLTLFAMVLAIGLLVDDAIVVVENINRLMVEEGLNPVKAAQRSMHEISGALFGVGLVIAAVFAPMSFFSGATGNIYRQFSLTIVSAMLLSIATALIITPSLCAACLKAPAGSAASGDLSEDERRHSRMQNAGLFERVFAAAREFYLKAVRVTLRHLAACLMLAGALAGCCVGLFMLIPTSFLPVEDQGILYTQIVLPPGNTRKDTLAVAQKVTDYLQEHEQDNIEGFLLNLGDSGGANRGQSTASVFVKLKDWSERPGYERSAQAIKDRVNRDLRGLTDVRINMVMPPSVRGMGPSAGFNIVVQNALGHSHDQFMQDVAQMVEEARRSPLLTNVRADTLEDSPQLKLSIDDYKAALYHLDPAAVNEDLSIAWAGRYVCDFVDRGRIKKVYVQSDARFRSRVTDLDLLYLRNQEGTMVPFKSVSTATYTYGPVQLQRFNGISSIPILGDSAPQVSSGEAMAEIERIVSEHGGHYAHSWQGVSFQERLSGTQSLPLFALSFCIVFLCLAALYESWSVPLSVMLIVPFGIVGALLMVWARSLVNDVYLQIGLITCGGLAAKNAILLIEYAHSFAKSGVPLSDSATRAAAIRFRPIIMTSVAFLCGVLPLMFAHGAGAASQISIGSAVVGGTAFATFVGVLFIPSFYVAVRRLTARLRRHSSSI
ncbi:MAG: efflux RND transporter permease subunit [Succinivibrio sp.]|nr:efflux RND transporter permease subunit [Succinivibrio sp.]